MFREQIEAELIGNRLHIRYFSGVVVVEDMNRKQAHEYLTNQVRHLDALRNNLLKEADKYIEE
jgi:hypothetical protein